MTRWTQRKPYLDPLGNLKQTRSPKFESLGVGRVGKRGEGERVLDLHGKSSFKTVEINISEMAEQKRLLAATSKHLSSITITTWQERLHTSEVLLRRPYAHTCHTYKWINSTNTIQTINESISKEHPCNFYRK